MTEAIKIVTLADIIFVVLLVMSGAYTGLIGESLYFLAFAVPIAIGFYSSRGLKIKREEIAGLAEPPETILGFDRRRAVDLLPLIAPVVALVLLVSLLTTFVLSLFSVEVSGVENRDIVTMLVSHALAPALLEEALFRYIPMKLLLPYSKRTCIVYSSLCFAFIHCSLAQMPYAFVAGIIFMIVDVALDSVWPSVILHFINNAASVIMMKYCNDTVSASIFLSVLLLLCAVSVFFIFKKKQNYKKMLKTALGKGQGVAVTYAPFALAAICLYIAVASII